MPLCSSASSAQRSQPEATSPHLIMCLKIQGASPDELKNNLPHCGQTCHSENKWVAFSPFHRSSRHSSHSLPSAFPSPRLPPSSWSNWGPPLYDRVPHKPDNAQPFQVVLPPNYQSR